MSKSEIITLLTLQLEPMLKEAQELLRKDGTAFIVVCNLILPKHVMFSTFVLCFTTRQHYSNYFYQMMNHQILTKDDDNDGEEDLHDRILENNVQSESLNCCKKGG